MKSVLLAAVSLGLMTSVAFAAGDAANGAAVAKVCAACHSEKDKTNKVGPSLVGVVGRPIATAEGYTYSDAMKKYATDNAGAVWDDARLNAYLKDPKGTVGATKMAFAGVKDDAKRADLIAYLDTLK